MAVEGAYALAFEKRLYVAAYLVDVIRLAVCYDLKEHGFETYKVCCYFVFWFLLDLCGAVLNGCSEARHVFGCDPTARLEEGVLLFDDVQLPFADTEVAAHEVVEGVARGGRHFE